MNQNWFHNARFGLFIHWGVYSVAAGLWKGKVVERIGEQIMRFGAIPVAEYETLAQEFNPTQFDADAWATLACDAGMKYVVLTAKHHDGFAMFDTQYSDFSIMKASPFKRDIVAELAEACRKRGLTFCLYYSQRQDWHEPDGVWLEWPGQFPVPPEERGVDFQRYMRGKALPQMRELLTHYGPLGLIWYDTPTDSTPEVSREFTEIVKQFQPDCLVCDRVGNGYGDYEVLGDNEFPYCPGELGGEVPATMNHTWGFKQLDTNWKSTRDLLYSLIRSVSNGCNYLLNIGPDATGTIPARSVEILREIGAWMKINRDAIHGATGVPFPVPPAWGMATRKGDKLYCFFENWPGKTFRLEGIRNQVVGATLPAAPDCAISFAVRDGVIELYGLPEDAPDTPFSVIELKLDGEVDVEPELRQNSAGTVTLLAGRATRILEKKSKLDLNRKGQPVYFHPGSGSLEWKFRIFSPGVYAVKALTNRHWSVGWLDGVECEWSCDGQTNRTMFACDKPLDNVQSRYYPETLSNFGTLTIREPGEYTLRLRVTAMPEAAATATAEEDREDTRTVNLIHIELRPE